MWTQIRVTRLVALWNEGVSASCIAERISEEGFFPTRNAVVAKVDRLRKAGHPMRTGGHEANRARRERPRRRPYGPPMVKDTPPKKPDIAALVLSQDDLADHHCRWIPDDPVSSLSYCGRPQIPGSAWCAFHAARVFKAPAVSQPVAKRPAVVANAKKATVDA